MSFFNIGPEEIFVILIITFFVFGPDRLPQLARQIGKLVRDFRRVTGELTAEFQAVTKEFSTELDELRQVTQDIQQELRGVQADLTQEMQGINATLRGDDPVAALSEPVTSAAASAGYAGYGAAYSSLAGAGQAASGTDGAGNTNGSEPKMASKENPRVDVALLDSDEPVVMPRSERPANGHIASNGHVAPSPATALVVAAPTAAPTPVRLTRRRSAAVIYMRQGRRAMADSVAGG